MVARFIPVSMGVAKIAAVSQKSNRWTLESKDFVNSLDFGSDTCIDKGEWGGDLAEKSNR
jgi:hypothetical protein